MAKLTAEIGQRTAKGTLVTERIQIAAGRDAELSLTIAENNAEAIASAIRQQVAVALDAIGIQASSDVADVTPVDTGRLRNSITHELEGEDAVLIGTNVEYAPAVELGTRTQTAQPYLVPTMNRHGSEYREYLKKALENA